MNQVIKKNVLFVGSFKKSTKDGSLGGQMFACNTILESEIGDMVNWILLDSTADSNLKSSFYIRAKKALIRILIFVKYLTLRRVDAVLIFTASGFSFIEKGIMVLIAYYTGKKVILAPRSGVVVRDIEQSAFMRWYIPIILNRADVVICQSQIWKKFYYTLEQSKLERYVVIENWIDIHKYTFLDSPSENIIENKVQILFLAWVDDNKGINELIDAMNIVRNKIGPNKMRLNICGKGEAYNDVVKRTAELGLTDICEFKGWVRGDEKIKMLRTSDIYVLPTYFEGFPNSLMEAMASGLPCIATAVGSIPDMIEDEYSGLIINPKDSQSLAEKLLILIEDKSLRLLLGHNARQKIANDNSIEETISKFDSIFKNLNLFVK